MASLFVLNNLIHFYTCLSTTNGILSLRPVK